MKIKYFDKFYEVRNEMYIHNNSEYVKETTGEATKTLWYKDVCPVFVYSLNKNWNGEETFDICPVDFSRTENAGASWRWRRTCTPDDIGKSIFLTEHEALTKYNEIPETQRQKYDEIKQLKRLS